MDYSKINPNKPRIPIFTKQTWKLQPELQKYYVDRVSPPRSLVNVNVGVGVAACCVAGVVMFYANDFLARKLQNAQTPKTLDPEWVELSKKRAESQNMYVQKDHKIGQPVRINKIKADEE